MDIELNATKTPEAQGSKASNSKAAQRVARAEESDMVEILIPKTKEDKADVYVSHNFRQWLVKRGVRTKVPRDLVTALQLAVGTQYVPEERDDGRIELIPTEVPSVPFQTF